MMPNLVSGFTLIELLVSLSIITIISGIVLTGQSTYNKTLVLANTAYDIALTLRSAETFGISSRAAGVIANTGYGVHFQKSSPANFTLFADSYPGVGQAGLCHAAPANDPVGPDARPGNCVYDAMQGERVVNYTMGNGITVSDFCAKSSGVWSCAVAQGGTLTSLDIVFSRPNPDPIITTNASTATAACLAVSSRQGITPRYVSIAASGQIIANALSCP